MTVTEAYKLEIVREEPNRTLIRKDGEEYWVKSESLELDAHPEEPDDWLDWMTESYVFG